MTNYEAYNEGHLTEYYPTCECGQRIDWEGIIDGYDIKWNENWKETAKEELKTVFRLENPAKDVKPTPLPVKEKWKV